LLAALNVKVSHEGDAMLSNHFYAANTPEGRALRSAFVWSALLIAVIAVLIVFGRGADANTPASTSANSAASEALSASAKASAYQQNKPLGSIFPKPTCLAQQERGCPVADPQLSEKQAYVALSIAP
jgi:hypothetical protein